MSNRSPHSAQQHFFGREEELECLKSFIQNDNVNIFTLYGIPMIGKSTLIREFYTKHDSVRNYAKIPVAFINPKNPQETLKEEILGNANISDLSFPQPTLIVIENFQDCLEWQGNQRQLHDVRKKYPLIPVFLQHIDRTANVKLVIVSRFQLNDYELGIRVQTLEPRVELNGIDVEHFRPLYKKGGVTDEEFDLICENFSKHTGLMATAHQFKSILQNNLSKAARRPKLITEKLWSILELIIDKLQKADTLILCALTLKPSISFDELETALETLDEFHRVSVHDSVVSLEQKFLIQDMGDELHINPYLREVLFTSLKRKRKGEMELLRRIDLFAGAQDPVYEPARQAQERGDYEAFYQIIHEMREEGRLNNALGILEHIRLIDPIINRGGILNEIGITLRRLKRYDDAITSFQDAIELGNIHSFTELALTYQEMEKYEKAIKTLNEGLDLEHDNIRILTVLGKILNEQRKYADAIRCLEKAEKTVPGDVKVLEVLAQSYCANKNPQKAKATIEKALRIEPTRKRLRIIKKRIKNNTCEEGIHEPKTEQLIRELNKLLSKDKLNKLIRILLERTELSGQQDLYDKTIQISGIYSSAKKSFTGDLSNEQQYRNSMAKVRVLLQDIIKNIKY